MGTKTDEKDAAVAQNSTMRDVFEQMDRYGHEQIIFCRHPRSDLKAIIAIHDTTMGPALGGCRMIPYKCTDEALEDVLKLSKGMTFKCGLADVDYGGGKMVIIGDESNKTPELFRAVGRFVQGLGKRFFTGTDMGTEPEDFIHAAKESNAILGLPRSYGGSGDTSILTAIGLLDGMRATAFHLWGTPSLEGRVIALQGVGKVGLRLLESLILEGATCIISDLHHQRLYEIERKYRGKVELCDLDLIYGVKCDLFSPCARGGVVNEQTVEQFQCEAIVGAANNQLIDNHHGDLLHEKGILYAPDYIVNAGGLIQVADEIEGYSEERAHAKTQAIYDILLQIFQRSKNENIPTCRAADRIVLERLDKVVDVRRIFLECS